MKLPDPHPGLVICYSYLWNDEHRRGREEGVKNRPCAIILARQVVETTTVVTVVPITHTPPDDPAAALEIPAAVKALLGLDDFPSWIVVTEVNDFVWPGPDLRPVPASNPARCEYGVLPPGLFRQLRDLLLATRETGASPHRAAQPVSCFKEGCQRAACAIAMRPDPMTA